MRKLGIVITYLSAALVIVFSLYFLVIEGRSLFSGDWLLYENTLSGFIRYFFRFLLSIYSLVLSISTYFILRKKYDQTSISNAFHLGVIALFISCIIVGIFSSNYLDYLLFILPCMYTVGVLLYDYGTKTEKEKE